MNDNHAQINNRLKSSRHYYAHNNKKKLNYYSRYSPKRNKVVQQNESPLTDRSPDQIKKARQSRKLSQNICQGQKYKPMFQLISEEELIANNKIQEIKAFQPLIYENRGQIFIDQDQQQQTEMKNIYEKSQQINNKKNNNDSIYILDDDDEQQKNYSKQSNNFLIKQGQKVSQKHSKNNQPLKYISNFPQSSQNMFNQPILNSKSQNQSFSIESDLSIIQQKWNSLFEQEINLDSILVLPTNDESNKIKNKEQKDYIDQKVDNNHHHDFINKQQQKLPSFQNYLQSQQFTKQPQNFGEYQRNKTFSRHFTFGSQIHSPEIMKQQQQEQGKEFYNQTSINFNSQNKAIEQQNQSSPLLKKLFSAEFAQKIINQDNIKKSKYKSRAKKMSNSQKINANFKKQKSQIKKIENMINHEEPSQKIRKNLFKQQFYEDIEEEKVSSKKQSGMNTERSTGQVIQLMSDQIKKFQAYPIQPQNLKVSRKKHDKLIKEQRWQKTIHQLLEKTTSRNETAKNSELERIKLNNLSSKNSKNQNNYNNISKNKSQISSVKARNSSQSSQIFSNQQQQDFINVNVSDQKRQSIDIQMMMQNEVEDYNESSMNQSSKKYSDLKDSQTDDMSRRIRFQRQSKKQKSSQKKSKENQSQFNQQTEEITKAQNSALYQSTYTQIFLKKLNRPHKKSVDVQESIIFLQNQSQQHYKQNPTMLAKDKDKEQGLNEVIDKDQKKQLKIGKDKQMVESYEIQDQSKEDQTILDQEDHLKLKKQQSQNNLENNKFGKKQLTLNARSTSFKYKDQQKTNNTNSQDQLQKLFQQSKSLQLLRQTIPTLPPELVNTYLTIYNKLLVTQAQHQARRSRQKMLLDILQMLIYFNKKKIDCESFLIQPFEEDFKQNLIEKQRNQQKGAIKIETEGQTNLNDQCSESGTNEDLNNLSVSQKTFKNQRKTIKMNQILLKGMIKQLASKII